MILVTGGAGFIGSNLASALAEAGQDVAICDHFGDQQKWRNVAKMDLADIVAPLAVDAWLTRHKVEAIVHMGAISSTTERNVDLIVRENYQLSRMLWTYAAREGVRYIYASSAATYGDGAAGFDDDASREALAKLRPLNPYGWSKHIFDRFVAREVARGGPTPPQWVGLKFFNVYGPNEYHKGSMKSVVAQVFPHAAAGEAVTLFRSHNPKFPDGGQMRDFIYVRDCVDVVTWLLKTPGANGLFNLGTGKARTFLDLANAVFAALNRKPNIAYVDTPAEIRDKYQYFTEAKMERLRGAGYSSSFISLEDGVGDYVQRYLSATDPYR
ncbi:MAG: ADP-glyceromanno-heptose 6-epimerase [Alphaproteobacteria bacterium]|nr:ADP-glyceromanno-heptose 6-epimerase [Alphaproteobacteria bacterium]